MHRKFRAILGVSQDATALIQLHPQLLVAIKEIAVQENSTVNEVANYLINSALSEHYLAETSLDTWQLLTSREREITVLIWWGLTNPQIAQRLSISQNTVKTHIKNILAKFKVNSKQALREMLSGLDFSEWLDLWSDAPLPPTNAASPDEANP